jgi:hypothetical protein
MGACLNPFPDSRKPLTDERRFKKRLHWFHPDHTHIEKNEEEGGVVVGTAAVGIGTVEAHADGPRSRMR